MLQKLLLGLLALTVIGAVSVGIYDATRPAEPVTAAQVEAIAEDNAADAATPPTEDDSVASPDTVAAVAADSSEAGPPAALDAAPAQQQNAMNMVGDPWMGSGTVTALDEVGVALALADGIEVYVELGPATYWQQQGLALAAGDVLTVEGFFNGEQIHAQTVTLNNGTQYAFRTAEGMPLWSGGSSNQNGNGQGANGDAHAEPQVAAEDWLTLSGVVTILSNGTLTMQIADGDSLQTQIGQPRFWQEQGVTLAIGDEIEVLGFWEGEQFRAGEIRLTATGERIMLLDPNGRPLWGGPGRSGESGAAGAAGNSSGNARGAASTAASGGQGGGNGNGYMGGRNQ